MAKFRQGDLVLTSTQKVVQGSETLIDENGAAKFDTLELTSGPLVNEIDTDVNLTADSDNKVASQKAVKAYVDSGGAGSSGTSGTSGVAGTSGTSGSSGAAGTSGTSGAAGTSGTSGTSGAGTAPVGPDNAVITIDGTSSVQATGVLIDDSDNITDINNLTMDGDLYVDGTSFVVNNGDVKANGQFVATREDDPEDTRVPWWNEFETRFDTSGDTFIVIDQTADSIAVGEDSVLAFTVTEDGLALESGARVNNITNDHLSDSTASLMTAYAIQQVVGGFWDASSTLDLSASGNKANMSVGYNSVGFGAALFMGGDGDLDEADASDSTTAPCIALALETGTGEKEVLLKGFIRDDSWSWSNIGRPIYLSTTEGEMTETPPSVSGDQVQILGIVKATNMIYFKPELTVIEVA